MKKLIKSFPVIINVEVIAYHPILELDEIFVSPEVVASRDLSDYKIPSGPIISMNKNKITQHMKSDFEAFMEDVELFCENNCNLIGIYKNVSEDNSYYYNYLATDSEGNIIVNFRLRLRISNHEPGRDQGQKDRKDSELESKPLKELLSPEEILKLKTYTKIILVNDEIYPDYETAMDDVFDTIEDASEKMRKNAKYRLKKSVPENFDRKKYREVSENEDSDQSW